MARRSYPPTASFTHLVVKLVLAAPASFLSAAWLSQVVWASFWHFVRKLVRAAPASFLASAEAVQVSARAPVAARATSATARASDLMCVFSSRPYGRDDSSAHRCRPAMHDIRLITFLSMA